MFYPLPNQPSASPGESHGESHGHDAPVVQLPEQHRLLADTPRAVALGALSLRHHARVAFTESVARIASGQLPVDTGPLTGNRHVARITESMQRTAQEGPVGRIAESITGSRFRKIAAMAGGLVVGATLSAAAVKYGIVPPEAIERSLILISGPSSIENTLNALPPDQPMHAEGLPIDMNTDDDQQQPPSLAA